MWHFPSEHRRRNRGGPSTFQTGGGMAPPLFWPSCSKVKKRPNRHTVKCLTWWKIVHQIASFKPIHFQKRSTSPLRHPPASRKRDGRRRRAIFYFKTPPLTLEIDPPPMRQSKQEIYKLEFVLKERNNKKNIRKEITKWIQGKIADESKTWWKEVKKQVFLSIISVKICTALLTERQKRSAALQSSSTYHIILTVCIFRYTVSMRYMS